MKEMRKKINSPVKFTNWIMLYASEDYDAAGTFTDTLIQCSKAYGITINEPKYIEVEGKKPKDWTDNLKSQFFKEC
jgi:hypothetical protein